MPLLTYGSSISSSIFRSDGLVTSGGVNIPRLWAPRAVVAAVVSWKSSVSLYPVAYAILYRVISSSGSSGSSRRELPSPTSCIQKAAMSSDSNLSSYRDLDFSKSTRGVRSSSFWRNGFGIGPLPGELPLSLSVGDLSPLMVTLLLALIIGFSPKSPSEGI